MPLNKDIKNIIVMPLRAWSKNKLNFFKFLSWINELIILSKKF